jgi:hypothetical protein
LGFASSRTWFCFKNEAQNVIDEEAEALEDSSRDATASAEEYYEQVSILYAFILAENFMDNMEKNLSQKLPAKMNLIIIGKDTRKHNFAVTFNPGTNVVCKFRPKLIHKLGSRATTSRTSCLRLPRQPPVTVSYSVQTFFCIVETV